MLLGRRWINMGVAPGYTVVVSKGSLLLELVLVVLLIEPSAVGGGRHHGVAVVGAHHAHARHLLLLLLLLLLRRVHHGRHPERGLVRSGRELGELLLGEVVQEVGVVSALSAPARKHARLVRRPFCIHSARLQGTPLAAHRLPAHLVLMPTHLLLMTHLLAAAREPAHCLQCRSRCYVRRAIQHGAVRETLLQIQQICVVVWGSWIRVSRSRAPGTRGAHEFWSVEGVLCWRVQHCFFMILHPLQKTREPLREFHG
mmetsp:Transcript_20597/g.51989  ORF Transcript_20597/g.51989 Transcript_20597/m.51989 type:complete len:256 (-) Transcript_20597:1266-2033(-)